MRVSRGMAYIHRMKRRKIIRTALLVVLLILVLIQFVPVDRSAPPVAPGQDFLQSYEMPTEFVNLVRGACYDCHSNEAKYPWYSYVAPLSFWIQGHIDEGREHLNFSEWASYDLQRKLHKLEEMAEEVEEGHMPLNSYTWLHPEAQLTDEQRQQLASWFNSLRH